MAGFGALVPPAQAAGAFATLGALGWRGEAPFSARLLEWRRGARFAGPGGRYLDLQWYLLRENCYPGADDPVWEAAQDGRLGPYAMRAPCAADQLLHVCIDGLQESLEPRIPWAADAFVLCAGGEVDWGRLAAEAARRRLALPVRTALRWIREELRAPVPDDALARLDALPVTRAERRELRAKLDPASRVARLRIHWSHHARAAAGAGRGRAATLVRFIPYLQQLWGVERAYQLPAYLLRRGMRRIWTNAGLGAPRAAAGPGVAPPAGPVAAPEPAIESRIPE
jgi:hypothetical protein